jgi:hypothetical protein
MCRRRRRQLVKQAARVRVRNRSYRGSFAGEACTGGMSRVMGGRQASDG